MTASADVVCSAGPRLREGPVFVVMDSQEGVKWLSFG